MVPYGSTVESVKGPAAGCSMMDRVRTMLDMRLSQLSGDGWLFPASTQSGHIEGSSLEGSSLRKQHARALKASGVAHFELYVLRHTCLTRWAKWMDPFTFHRVAGHTDMKTTMRYVHPRDDDMDRAIAKAREVQGGHSSGHTDEEGLLGAARLQAGSN
jgi:integrase